MEVLGTRGCESYKPVPRPGLRRFGEDFMKEVALEGAKTRTWGQDIQDLQRPEESS